MRRPGLIAFFDNGAQLRQNSTLQDVAHRRCTHCIPQSYLKILRRTHRREI
jgi:hypothetical protein